MAPKEESSLPLHIGNTIVEEMMRINKQMGEMSGHLEGVQVAVGGMNDRLSHAVTREEFTKQMDTLNTSMGEINGQLQNTVTKEDCAVAQESIRQGRPSQQVKKFDVWDRAHKRIAVVTGAVVLAVMLSGAGYWAVQAYDTIERAKTLITKVQDSGV